MIKTKKQINLSGVEGNAFYLLSIAHDLSKSMKLDWDKIKAEMMSSDYSHLKKIFLKNFGNYIEFIEDKNNTY